MSKKALFMVHFGTTHNDTRELTIDKMNKKFADEFKDYDLFTAYTSRIVLKRLKDRGENYSTPLRVLNALVDQGYEELLIQTSHVIPGIEYENLVRENRELRENLELKSNSTSEYIVANTILIESLIEDNILYIDKGANDGIEQYLPVLLNGNVIGRINRVSKNYSEVQLLSNPDFKMAVDINGHIQGILRGKGNSEFVINNFNDELVDKISLFNIKTSGISELYPKGLSIGKFNVSNKKSLIDNKTLILKLNFDLSKVSTLVVYKYDKNKINLINKIIEERSGIE